MEERRVGISREPFVGREKEEGGGREERGKEGSGYGGGRGRKRQ